MKIKSEDAPGYRNALSNDDDIIAAAREIMTARACNGQKLTSPDLVSDYLKMHFAGEQFESMIVLYLNIQHQIIEAKREFRGTIDGASIYPRVIATHALQHNAAAVIVAHNHPSGNTEPSIADRSMTRRLAAGLDLLGVRLLDHLIIAGNECLSMSAQGML